MTKNPDTLAEPAAYLLTLTDGEFLKFRDAYYIARTGMSQAESFQIAKAAVEGRLPKPPTGGIYILAFGAITGALGSGLTKEEMIELGDRLDGDNENGLLDLVNQWLAEHAPEVFR